MKNFVKILLLSAISILSFASCVGLRTNTVIPIKPMNSDEVRLDLKMEDFQLLGEEKCTIIYRKYLGISNIGLFTVIDSINGLPQDRRNVKTVYFNALTLANNPLVAKAIAPIMEKYPQADFVTPVYTSTQSHLMFGGSKNKLTVKVKIYKFKP